MSKLSENAWDIIAFHYDDKNTHVTVNGASQMSTNVVRRFLADDHWVANAEPHDVWDIRTLQEQLAALLHTVPRGTGSYSTRGPNDPPVDQDKSDRIFALKQAIRWMGQADTLDGYKPDTGKVCRAIAAEWITRSKTKRLSKKTPKLFPGLKWEGVS